MKHKWTEGPCHVSVSYIHDWRSLTLIPSRTHTHTHIILVYFNQHPTKAFYTNAVNGEAKGETRFKIVKHVKYNLHHYKLFDVVVIVFIEVDVWCDDVDDYVLCMAFGMCHIRFIQLTTDLFAVHFQLRFFRFSAFCDDVIVVIVVGSLYHHSMCSFYKWINEESENENKMKNTTYGLVAH